MHYCWLICLLFQMIYRSFSLANSWALSLPCNLLLEVRSFFFWRVPSLDFANCILVIVCFSVSVLQLSCVVWNGSYVWLLGSWNSEFELKLSLNWDVQLHIWLTFLLDSADLEAWSHLHWNFLARIFHRPCVSSRRINAWLSLCDPSSHWLSRPRFIHFWVEK